MGTAKSTRPSHRAPVGDRRQGIIAALLIVAIGAALRCLAVTDDFWLDEIWSLSMALKAGSAWEIFEKAHDNNHHLNTLFLYLLGQRDGWLAYRSLALVCGLGTLVLAVLVGFRRGRLVGSVSGVLLSASFFMIVYSTEARGYGPALFLAFACFLVLQGTLETETGVRVLGFSALVILGFSSHFSFGAFYLAALVWSAVRFLKSRIGQREAILRWVRLHAIPVAYLVSLYLLVLSRLRVGGGPPWTLGQVLDELMAWSIGCPVGIIPAALGVLVLLVVLAWDTWELRREGSDEWVFYVLATLLAPISTLVILKPDYLFPRYFFISMGFFLLVLARCIVRVSAKGPWGAVVAGLLVGLFCIGNAFHIGPFLKHGRGHYGEALHYMAESTQDPIISVASDHDFRNQMVVNYHKRFLPPGKNLVYYNRRRFPRQAVRWILTHSQALHPNPPRVLKLPTGHVYVLRKHFPYYGPSGWHWFVYEKGSERSPHSDPAAML